MYEEKKENMKTKSKILFSSFLAIIFCLSLMVGATFALFTSESKVNVAVTSGKVSVVATAEDLKMYSGVWNEESNDYESTEVTDYFSNGGSASIEENTVTLDRVTPMDKVEFNIRIHNDSNVNVLYQTKIELVDGASLYTGLKVSVDGKNYDGMTAYSNWDILVPGSEDIVVPVSIELPQGAGNRYQDLGCTIAYSISAIQGNAHVEQPAADENTVYIYNASDLRLFAVSVNAGNKFTDKTVLLMADIDLENEEFTPIGNSTYKFDGDFDGQGYVISNLSITGNKSNVGLFGYTVNGSVKNVTVNNAKVSGYLNVGVVAGTPYTSTYDNIKVTGLVQVDGFAYVGGLFGKNLYANASNLTIDATEDSYVSADSYTDGIGYRTYVGGIVGFIGEGNHSLTNVTSNIDVYGTICDVGGITGIAHYGNHFINCVTTGDVHLEEVSEAGDCKEIGGIAGVWHNGGNVTLENCEFKGQLYASYVEDGNVVPFTDFHNSGIVGSSYNTSGTGRLVIDGVLYTNNPTTLYDALLNGENIVLSHDVESKATATAPYGNKMGYHQKGGVLDGNGHTISVETNGDHYGIMTSGGTIKNLTINDGYRAIMVMSATEDVVLENVVVSGSGIGYALNTGEASEEIEIKATNCTFNGWSSFANVESATFTNCKFGQGTYYGATSVFGRLVRPYVNTTFDDCEFIDTYYFDFSALADDITVNFVNCKYGDTTLSAENFIDTIVAGGAYEGNDYSNDVAPSIDRGVILVNNVVVVANVEVVEDIEDIQETAKEGGNIVLSHDVEGSAVKGGYSVAGLSQAGGTIDGNGNTLTVNDANSTWACGIYTNGGTIKNLTINGSFRGIFTAGQSSDIIIDNVVIDKVCYTFSADDGKNEYSVIVTNSTLNGWTSYGSVFKDVSFTNCNFGKGTGGYQYAYCRPYQATTFTNCNFEAGYGFDASQVQEGLVFVDCYYNGQLITQENLVEFLGQSAANILVNNSNN